MIVVVSLVAGLIGFAVSLVASVAPFDAEDLREEIKQSIEQSMEYNPGWDQMDPEARRYAESAIEDVVDMIADIASMKSPLPRGVAGFFEAVGGWLSRVPASLAGWMFYGVLVLVCVNLLGGSAKLGDFLGMVALYSIPGLLAIFNPLLSQVGVLSCLGSLLSIVVLIWSVVVYIKGTSVISGLDLGRATAAVAVTVAVAVPASTLSA